MNTYGDMNILDKNEYIDASGKKKKEIEGVVREIPEKQPIIQLFPVSKEDKSWF